MRQHTLPNGRTIILGGRRPPERRFEVALFSQAVNAAALPAPPEWNWNASNPSLNPQGQGNILDNDEIGDCFWAAMGHIFDSERGASGNPNYTPITTAQTISSYAAATGYNPSTGANDDGTVLTQGLAFCQKPGFVGASPIVGFASVDATNIQQVKTAAWLFGNLVGGFCVPSEYMRNLTRWALVGPGSPNDGHAIASPEGGYNTKALLWNSWGCIIPMDWDAVQFYFSPTQGGEMYVVFTEDGLNKASGKAPSGFDAAALTAYLKDFAP